MIVYLVKFRPFKSELQQVVVVSDEFVVIGGVALLYVLYHYQYDPQAAYQISVAIISVILVSFVKNICIIMFLSIRKYYIKFKNWVHKKYNVPELKRQRLIKELETFREKQRQQQSEYNTSLNTENYNQTGQHLHPINSQIENTSNPDSNPTQYHSPKSMTNPYHINIKSPDPHPQHSSTPSHNTLQPPHRQSADSAFNGNEDKRAIIEQMRNFQKAPPKSKFSKKLIMQRKRSSLRSNSPTYPYRPKYNGHEQGQVNGSRA